MVYVEVSLLVIGIICVIVSIVMDHGREETESAGKTVVSTDLTEEQLNDIKNKIDEMISREISDIEEKTEASLDKISNTKILEFNEYAENVLGEISRNHNETVFLYDMLNEKAKEVKTTVKDINIAKRQVEKIHAEVSSADGIENEPSRSLEDDKPAYEKAAEGNKNPKDIAKERLVELMKKSNERDSMAASDSSKMNIRFEKGTNNNEKILKLYEMGLNNKEIAKQLNLGIGEVKLVIDLYNGGR